MGQMRKTLKPLQNKAAVRLAMGIVAGAYINIEKTPSFLSYLSFSAQHRPIVAKVVEKHFSLK